MVVVQLMCLSGRERTGSSSQRCPGFESRQLPHNALHKCIVGCQRQQGAMKIIANYTDTEIFNSSKIVKLMMVNRFVLHATLRCSKSHYLSVEPNPCYHRTDNTNDIHENRQPNNADECYTDSKISIE